MINKKTINVDILPYNIKGIASILSKEGTLLYFIKIEGEILTTDKNLVEKIKDTHIEYIKSLGLK